MPYFAAIAVASALFYYLRAPQPTRAAVHSAQVSSDMGGGDLNGSDLAQLYLDELRSLHDYTMPGGGPVSPSGTAAAGVPVQGPQAGVYGSPQSYTISSGGLYASPSNPSGYISVSTPPNVFGNPATPFGGGGGGSAPGVGAPAHGVGVA